MTTHIYLSVGKFNSKTMVHPKSGVPNCMMNYRGAASKNDDPAGFIRRMNKQGHAVVAREKPIMPGEAVTVKAFGKFIIQYPDAYADQMDALMEEAGAA